MEDLEKCLFCDKRQCDDLGGEEWICCTKCVQWFHVDCAGVDPVPPEEEKWLCKKCCGDASYQRKESAKTDEDEKELQVLNDLIQQQEKLCALQQRRLELMEKMSQKATNEKVDKWINKSRKTHKADSESDSVKLDFHSVSPSSKRQNKTEPVAIATVSTSGAIPKQKNEGGDSENNMMSLLTTQMQLMCRSYLEELPNFDGDAEFWPVFYAQYISTTTQGGFNNAHNLCRLRKCLKGEAFEAVKGLLALPDSLEDVIDVLKKRFGSMEIIVKRKMKKLDELAAPNENKPITVKNFHEFLRGTHATLLNAGAEDYLSSPQTLDAVVCKLPPGMMRAWILQKKKLGCRGTLIDFIKWFERYYDCAVLSDREVQSADVLSKRNPRVNVHKDSRDNESIPPPTRNEQCSYCRKSNHATLIKCQMFLKLPLRMKWNFVRKRRFCFLCLQPKHAYKNCAGAKVCDVNGCGENHHRILHKDKMETEQQLEVKNDKHNESSSEMSATVNSCSSVRKTHFRVVPVIVSNPESGEKVTTWAFLDEGSSPTMMSAEVATKLGVSGVLDELCVSWTDSSVKKESNSQRVTIDISGVAQSKKFRLYNVRTVENLNLPMPELDLEKLRTKYKHFADVSIPQIPLSSPQILIGLEHPKLGLAYETREGAWNEPVATKTRLGWTIHGKESAADAMEYFCHVCECNNDDSLHDMVRQYFTTESLGVKIMEQQLASKEDERARMILEKTTRNVGNRYETGLLWRSDNVLLPENKAMAMRRLVCFEQKLRKDPALQKTVLEKMDNHFKKGYLRKLNDEELCTLGSKRHWYLPIFSVSNINKNGKVRLVFDAAAKYNGISLNDVLLTGPDQLASLFGVLLRFREGRVALSADICEMFHRVQIIEEDQYCQLILWRDLDSSKAPETFVMTVMTFGSTCSPSSAQYTKNTNAMQFKEEFPRAVDAIVNRHYVDDWLDSFDSEELAIQTARQVHHIHSQGGFEIRNWISNSTTVARAMNSQPEGDGVIDLNVSNDIGEEKVLGLHWNTTADQFVFRLSFNKLNPKLVRKEQIPSKREVLRAVMSVYDPLGFLSIITIFGKIFLQVIWRTGIEWDHIISKDLVAIWNDWLDSLYAVPELKISRWYFNTKPEESSSLELHVFSDASESAFAACAYLRSNGAGIDDCHVTLVAAKTKVAPQKALSIPRLELQGCLLAARLQATLKSELSVNISSVVMWTDSQTALGWIRSSKRKYSSFVSHRVSEILDTTTVEQWRWVPGKQNVADDATRGMHRPYITERWFSGPDFLIKNHSMWPKEEKRVTHTDEEVRQVYVHVTTPKLYTAIQASRFSKYERLLRSSAYALRFISILKTRKDACLADTRRKDERKRKMSIQELLKLVPALESHELRKAEDLLFKKNQYESYVEDIHRLRAGKTVSKSSRIYTFNPYLDENGVIRLASRLDAAPIMDDENVKRPVLLDPGHEITALIIDSVHRKYHHRGKETVINELRQYLWVPKVRALVNRVVKHCSLCKYLKAKPVIPKMAPLPSQRLEPYLPAFSYTGTDFFGPIEVTVGRRREKRWGMIFTCLTSRAIHLELASSLDTSSAIMCYRNFVNRRGTPLEMFSDNGTNLKGAEKELRLAVQELDMNEVVNRTTTTTPCAVKTKWSFIPPGAPHFGGIWERMIGTVKGVLYIILRSKAPRDETLRSALIEAENIVNCRPLTYSSSDIDSPEAISPNLLIRGPAQNSLELPGEYNCRKQWRIAQALADSFWKRWLVEYLPLIAIRTKWYDETLPLSIGQLVLVVDETLKRNEWKKGVITKVFPSKDGKIRSAEVRTSKGVYIRPVAKLAVIKDQVISSATCPA